ncbi:hypothetical protein [Nesterenkonia alkaliphila]|uniref:Uncharacterized protein n=1 Tax=Nesterenkonia alkaliphila TaxID=1463631 RepID=A0A7K1UFA3_9MICC|nr:hypothetical protein [Nesterenkonia alkaliphila]MVT25064.1 hypothetical protein [Nesterenkonia alkaliphila]
MTTHEENAEARVRFDPVVPGWMVATVEGVRLASAPVRETEIDLAARELTRILGIALSVDIYDGAGHATRMVVGPPTEQERPGCG